MKKQRLTSVLLFFLTITFLFTSYSYSAEEAGQVLAVKKDVYRVRENIKDNAKPQMKLYLKDAVETEKQSRTKLFFTDDSVLNLGELSRVEVEEYIYTSVTNRSKSIYRLIDGSLKVVVGRSDLEVHTASAVAAARGTKFIMWSKKGEKDRKRQECVTTLEGKVLFRLKKEAITPETKKDNVIVDEGAVSCISGDIVPNVEDARPIQSTQMEQLDEELSVFAEDIRQDELPAFAPPPVVEFHTPGEPPIPQQPVEIIQETGKQGDFERIK